MAAEDADRQMLINVATRGKNPKDREDAAAEFKRVYGEDVPEPPQPGGDGLWGAARRVFTPDEPDAPFLGAAARELGSEVKSMGYAAGFPVAPSPRNAETNEKLALFGERASNMVTGGASRGVMDLLHASSPQQRQQLSGKYPGGAFAADLLGAGIGAGWGVPGMIDRAVRSGVSMAAPALAETAGANLVAGAGSGIAQNATMNASEGKPLLENSGAAAGMGAGGAALAEVASGASRLLRRDPWIGRYARAKERGVYQDPEVMATKDVQQASEQAREGFDRRNAHLETEAGTELDQARGPFLQDDFSRREILKDISARLKANTEVSSGLPKDPKMEKALLELAAEMGPHSVRGQGGRMQPVPDPSYQDIIDRRTALRKSASFGSVPPSESQELARTKYDVLRESVERNAPPEARAAEAEFHAQSNARRGERDIVYGTENEVNRGTDADPDVRVSKEKAGARFFRRAGDPNIPGTENRSYHEDLAKADPVYADLLERVTDIKARESMRPGFAPRVPPTFSGALSFGGIPGALEQLIVRPALGRLVEPALARAGRALPKAARLVPLLRDPLDAFKESRRRQENDQ